MTTHKTSKASKSGGELSVPLDKLKKSPKNVRKVPHTDADIAALAASIAANGLLQNLVVEPEANAGKPTGYYLVNIGEGRRLAQVLRAKRKEIAKTEPVRCLLGDADRAEEASLAENVIRSNMHPADEYEAFALLHNGKGLAAEDIAARFGVSVAVVRQRLKLGAVSPVLMHLYRAGDMSLDQLMAFTITDDHARQEEVWRGPGYDNGAYAIRRALTEGQVAANDRRATFIGAEAYIAAGGVVVRDLFDAQNGGYFADAALLDRLVLEKLEREAAAVRGEGWAWVTVTPEFDHRATSSMRRVYPQAADISAKAQRKLEKLGAEYDELASVMDNEEVTEDMETRLAELEAAIETLKGAPVFAAADIAAGGAFVSLGFDGGVRVERGFISKADVAALSAETTEAEPASERAGASALPDKLVAQLTAHRTLALREAVANRPDIAFVAVVHALAVATFYVGVTASCLDIRASSAFLSGHTPGIDESPLGRAASERQARLAALLPENVQDLWQTLLAFTQEQLMQMLAHCAALTIDGVVRTKHPLSPSLRHVETLAQAVSLDMAVHWQPTATGYLGQVTKDTILAAVREAVSETAARTLADLKKAAMAEAAERLLEGKRWLPAVLRLPQQPQSAVAAA